ncbi:MAG: AAA family ATPase [Alphaproteobacteria bacterium]
MILEANERAGGSRLARHLVNAVDNDHVEIHELRGFVSNDLFGAFKEIQAVSIGTKAKNYLFSISLNPPSNKNVPVKVFEDAIERIEKKLGLVGQPRAIVFHEKEGRRHAHCVFSRINIDQMKAINLSLYKEKLTEISRELFLEHDWQMPPGLENYKDRDPLNFKRAEWQQAKRTKQDVRVLKKLFQDCWAVSDSQDALANALAERGFTLAKGDRRGYVAIDWRGEICSISRWVGIKAKEVRAKLGDPDTLPSVDDVKRKVANGISHEAREIHKEAMASYDRRHIELQAKRADMVAGHRAARETLRQEHEAQRIAEIKARSERLPTGIKAAWAKLSGHYQTLRQEIEAEAHACDLRDQAEAQKLIERQLNERRVLQHDIRILRHHQSIALAKLYRDTGTLLRSDDLTADPRQYFVPPEEWNLIWSAEQIRSVPERVLDVITDKDTSFSRNDIVRKLAEYIDDPAKLRIACDEVMASGELVKLPDTPRPLYSTREMERLHASLNDQAKSMARQKTHSVGSRATHAAIHHQNAKLQKAVGANLSDEQCHAINHVLDDNQLSTVVGFAGSGKSTMLAAAHDAWTKQGYRVLGAALSGKAADGLQEASSIASRTLASFETSWNNGFNQLQRGDVLVIDEAGMVGTRQILRFFKEARLRGAKLVLVGDPEQLQPINAGTPFRDILKQIENAELTEIRRQKENWQRQATRDFAQNKTAAALKAYADRGAVEQHDRKSDAITALMQDYMADFELRGASASRLALAYRRKDAHALNQAVRKARQSGGELVDEKLFKTNHGPRAFAAGDRIIFTKNDTSLGVKNGTLGTVEKFDEYSLTVLLDGNGQGRTRNLTFSPKQYASIDHGYATTIHKSQGATVDHTFVLSSGKMDRHLTYVAMSRHRDTAKLYVDNSLPQMMKTERVLSPRRMRMLTLG